MSAGPAEDRVRLLGIRHHGPGCARSVRAALEAWRPDVVLVEGPADAQDALAFAGHAGLVPPVALLVHAKGAPERSAVYPFVEYSPEWQALRWAAAAGVPARLFDLPLGVRLALDDAEREAARGASESEAQGVAPPGGPEAAGAPASGAPEARAPASGAPPRGRRGPRADPLAALAAAAGAGDPELWWEEQVERRGGDALELFQAIHEAMAAARAEAPALDAEDPEDREELLREAHMRQALRAATREYSRVAVVCGAWHVPALAEARPVKEDAARLKGLPRLTVEATWIPWTHARLTLASGYGAGVRSPGWYRHLWHSPRPQDAGARWVVEAARLLRAEDLPASSAGAIEAVRLADALAALRGLRTPGLAELNEALLSVVCGGHAAPMAVVRRALEVGDVLGEVPPDVPQVPLQRDLLAHARRLRLKQSPEAKVLELDLREETDRERSRLLHRLQLLGVAWGTPRRAAARSTGTFKEAWELTWRPELEVSLIEASRWGNTLDAAADARTRDRAEAAAALPELTALLEAVLQADLPGAAAHVLARVQAQGAVATDVQHLMEALPPLARVARYGDVRGTRAEALGPVLEGLFARACVGLPVATATPGVDAEAAGERLAGMRAVHESVALLDRADWAAAWRETLEGLAMHERAHPRVRGGACRLLLELGALEEEALGGLAGRALSHAVPPLDAAAWAEGLLEGSGHALLPREGLWRALDAWLAGLRPEAFQELLPLVRRAFAGFAPPERRAMGERVRRLSGAGAAPGVAPRAQDVDAERAARVLPVLARVLGVEA